LSDQGISLEKSEVIDIPTILKYVYTKNDKVIRVFSGEIRATGLTFYIRICIDNMIRAPSGKIGANGLTFYIKICKN